MNKLSSNIKRRRTAPEPQREFEHILPTAISAVSSHIPNDIEITQVYIELRQGNVKLGYDYQKE